MENKQRKTPTPDLKDRVNGFVQGLAGLKMKLLPSSCTETMSGSISSWVFQLRRVWSTSPSSVLPHTLR